jgi:hypothetical protein
VEESQAKEGEAGLGGEWTGSQKGLGEGFI